MEDSLNLDQVLKKEEKEWQKSSKKKKQPGKEQGRKQQKADLEKAAKSHQRTMSQTKPQKQSVGPNDKRFYITDSELTSRFEGKRGFSFYQLKNCFLFQI